LKGNFVDSGKVTYAYRSMPLANTHPRALRAAAAAECADEQGRFWEMRAALFTRQTLEDPDLVDSAAQLGLDVSRFNICVERPGRRFQDQLDEAKRLGISSVPTFLVGTLRSDGMVAVRRRINGAQPVKVFASAIDAVMSSVAR
jgi:NhaA family Na+:H+ antiporter